MNHTTRILSVAAILLFVSLFFSSKTYAGCGGTCISTTAFNMNSGHQTIHTTASYNLTLYASYDGCCGSLFGQNMVIGWYLNNVLIATTTTGINNGGYYYAHQLVVSQPGTYTVTFGSAATDSLSINYNPCGRVTVLHDALPMNGPVLDNMGTPADNLAALNNTSFFVPGAFTPDGNGVNDLFKPVYSTSPPQDYHLQIFDKMGNLVFETRDASQGWDGKVRSGRPAQVDVYIWKIHRAGDIVSSQPSSGKVCVIR